MKNNYYSNFGNNDIDVLGIQLIRLDDIIDYYIRLAYIHYPQVREKYKQMNEGRQKYIKFVEEDLIDAKIKNFEDLFN